MMFKVWRLGFIILVASFLSMCNQNNVPYQESSQVMNHEATSSPTQVHEEVDIQETPTPMKTVEWELVTFPEKEGYLPNPFMGWQDTESISPRFPESVGYRRFNWSELNPSPENFAWDLIDDFRSELVSSGGQISWRIRTARPAPFGPGEVMPNWVIDQGAQILFSDENGSEPRFTDCVFLETHGNFIDAMRVKYDGDRDVAFIDVGSYGSFGEWDSDQYDATPGSLDWHARRRIIDMYLGGDGERPCTLADGEVIQFRYSYEGFQHTQMVMGYTPWFEDSLIYALSQREDVGIRQDSLGSEVHQEYIRELSYELFQNTWPRAPIVFEFDNLAYTSDGLKRAREFAQEMHITFVHDNLEGRGQDEEISAILELIGYRLRLINARFEKLAQIGGELTLEMNWVNSGVAPPYVEFPFVAVLTDMNGTMVLTQDFHSDITTWLPGDPFVISREIYIPANLAPGMYFLKIAILDPTDGKPAITLANEGQDELGYYLIGQIELTH